MANVLPDAEKLAVQWAKSRPAITDIVGTRVATRLPKDPPMPFLTVFRATGGRDSGEAPIDIPYLQWDCYAAQGPDSPDYDTAYHLGAVLVAEAEEFQGRIPGFGYILGFTNHQGPRRLDESATGWARYVVEMSMMTREE